jgi:uncharacterized membrane-anchored protein YhcB (DUF1043 family)
MDTWLILTNALAIILGVIVAYFLTRINDKVNKAQNLNNDVLILKTEHEQVKKDIVESRNIIESNLKENYKEVREALVLNDKTIANIKHDVDIIYTTQNNMIETIKSITGIEDNCKNNLNNKLDKQLEMSYANNVELKNSNRNFESLLKYSKDTFELLINTRETVSEHGIRIANIEKIIG